MACTCGGLRALSADVAPGMLLKLFPHQRAALRWMLAHEGCRPPPAPPSPPPSPLPDLPPSSVPAAVPTDDTQPCGSRAGAGQGASGEGAGEGQGVGGRGVLQGDGPPVGRWGLASTLGGSSLAHRWPHPYIVRLVTSGGLFVDVNLATGELSTQAPPPRPTPLRGGLFCDEPGLGKTVTALSLVLRTQGTRPTPPLGEQVLHCPTAPHQAYYVPGAPHAHASAHNGPADAPRVVNGTHALVSHGTVNSIGPGTRSKKRLLGPSTAPGFVSHQGETLQQNVSHFVQVLCSAPEDELLAGWNAVQFLATCRTKPPTTASGAGAQQGR
ncbi:hypothetical protein V8C86DRAFT_441004 [Haematococcus lacustris]